jgi:hypothetical protein
MYAVGNFTQIRWNGATYSRNNAFSFSATSPFTMTSWNPDINGAVNSIAFNGNDCANAYIGGRFSSLGNTKVANIAQVSTTTGKVVSGFGTNANNTVNTLLATPNGHLLAGGAFTSINGGSAHARYASLNLSTGRDDSYLNLNIFGHIQTDSPSVFNQQLSHSGAYVLAEGVFTSVQGKSRQQIFIMHLGRNHGYVTNWTSSRFSKQCDKHPFYIHAAAWSPDDSRIYVADSGFRPLNWNHTFPLYGLCDAVAAFPATHSSVGHLWVNYSGCDSFYSVAVDNSAVYAAGHERWADNAYGCNRAGKGAITAPGMGGFTPTNGSLLLNSGGTAGLYSRGRGYGADDALLTSAGLWIASDNFEGTDSCGGVSGHAGICFLPYN